MTRQTPPSPNFQAMIAPPSPFEPMGRENEAPFTSFDDVTVEPAHRPTIERVMNHQVHWLMMYATHLADYSTVSRMGWRG